MRNVDKYLAELLSIDHSCKTVYRMRTGKTSCVNIKCSDCVADNKKWLEAEYVEPEVDE